LPAWFGRLPRLTWTIRVKPPELEASSGHHLQIALGQERTDLPLFRRKDEPKAFVEGWALYAEQLGEEMAVYRDAHERFGRLSFDMWRACRLEMDVGIHWKGWIEEQAERRLRDNTALPETAVVRETQRHASRCGNRMEFPIIVCII
jgi:uncharacterized protein (DUF885 family)